MCIRKLQTSAAATALVRENRVGPAGSGSPYAAAKSSSCSVDCRTPVSRHEPQRQMAHERWRCTASSWSPFLVCWPRPRSRLSQLPVRCDLVASSVDGASVIEPGRRCTRK